MQPGDPIDARGDRASQAAVGVLLLAGFVFRLPWLVPIVGLLLAGGAVIGAHADAFEQLFATLLRPRLPAADTVVDPATVRAQDLALAALCLIATVAFLVITPLGWLVAIGAAIVAIVAASAGLHLGEWAVLRLFPRRPPRA